MVTPISLLHFQQVVEGEIGPGAGAVEETFQFGHEKAPCIVTVGRRPGLRWPIAGTGRAR